MQLNDMNQSTLCTGKFLALIKEGHWEYAQRTNATGAAKATFRPSNGASMPFNRPLPSVVSKITSGSLMPVYRACNGSRQQPVAAP